MDAQREELADEVVSIPRRDISSFNGEVPFRLLHAVSVFQFPEGTSLLSTAVGGRQAVSDGNAFQFPEGTSLLST